MLAEIRLNPSDIIIEAIKILKGHIDSPFSFNEDEVDGYTMAIELKLGSNVKIGRIKAELIVEVSTDSKQGANEVEAEGKFHFAYVFLLQNMTNFFEESGDSVKVHPILSNAIASICYSTARGILLTRFQGTSLSKFILPVVDPNSLFTASESVKPL